MGPVLQDREAIIRSAQGALDGGSLFLTWRIGKLHLTNRRLLFERLGEVHFVTPLCNVVDVRLELRKWLLQQTKQLSITYRLGDGEAVKTVYVAIWSPASWQMSINDAMTMAVLELQSPCHGEPGRPPERLDNSPRVRQPRQYGGSVQKWQ
ncbi:MAG: hypothetical protein NTU41_09105 [Chloroflexi bacterium]|nr:hypothetical protein [Chloroflexota bacterium]